MVLTSSSSSFISWKVAVERESCCEKMQYNLSFLILLLLKGGKVASKLLLKVSSKLLVKGGKFLWFCCDAI